MASKPGAQKLFSAQLLKTKYDLWPLLGMLGVGCGMATAFSIYSVYQKPDVRLDRRSAIPPWEEVDPEKPQKLMDYNTGKYKKIPEIEQLRREIGSYQLK